MKASLAICFFLGVATTTFAADPTLAEARLRLLSGNYEEAKELYEQLAKAAPTKAKATVGLSRALEAMGEYDRALEAVESLLKDAPKDADLLARQAELLYQRGRWEEAEKAAEAAIVINKDRAHFQARWVRARIYRDRGELAKAEEEYRWFVKAYNAREAKDDPVKDPDDLLCIALAAIENAHGKKELAGEFKDVLDDLLGDALKNDKKYWPAEYTAGMLLLEKYNRGDALDAFDKALVINPSAAEALVGKGGAELQRFEGNVAMSFADRALKINPRLPEALRLKADVYFTGGEYDAARKELDKAKLMNPRDERTLARIAACLKIQGKKKEYEEATKEPEKFDTKPATFWYELGERLEDRRYYADAETCYKKAIDLRPLPSAPKCNLGMLYMRMGREKEAAVMLDKGFEADPFHVRVSNLRKVLDHLKKYEKIETKHFLLKYSKDDSVLAHYMAIELEALWEDLATQFKHKPDFPILVEVFSTHAMFSGRTVALPDLHTIGACTGRMFAMVSPNGQGIRKPFNWLRVLRHEIVHIFNLDQTNFLVPHWLTEGIAVGNEGFPRPPIWNQLLKERVPEGKNLLDLDNIDLGFIRPRDPLQWQQAYCQANLYVEYLRSKYGPESISGLLAAYRDGLNTTEAIKKVCKVDKAEFEKGYKEYLETIVKKIGGRPIEKKRSLKTLKAEFEKDPGNADLAGELAESYLERGDRIEARNMAKKAIDKKAHHPRGSLVLARLARQAGNLEEEKRLLEDGLDRADPYLPLVSALAKLHYDTKQYAKAADMLELARKTDPQDPEWATQLTRVYAQTGERDKLIQTLKDVLPTDADDLERRKKLTRLLLETNQFAEAEKYAKQCLEIDIRDKESRDAMLKALKEQKKDDAAKKYEDIFVGK